MNNTSFPYFCMNISDIDITQLPVLFYSEMEPTTKTTKKTVKLGNSAF